MKTNRTAIKSLTLRLTAQYDELATCKTTAEFRCVWQAICDTTRQLTELRG
jgi:hypothetical protein